MRVTANTFPNSLVDQLNRLANRQYQLQNMAATGQRIRLPEDDPTAMRRVLDMQAETKGLTQYTRNIERLQEVSTASFNSLKALKNVSDRAGEIAVRVDDLKSPAELTVLADEVNELIKQALQVANSRNRADALFGGTKSDVDAFVAATDASGRITGVTYQGNTDLVESEIGSGVTIAAQVIGENRTGSGSRGLLADSRVGADFFGHLISLRESLLVGDVAAVDNDRAGLMNDEENFIYHLGTNGAVQGRLDTTMTVIRNRQQSLEKLVSREADADLSQTIVRLTEVQTAYQAAMQSGGTILNRSLLDFIR